jgi:hypothetical protein
MGEHSIVHKSFDFDTLLGEAELKKQELTEANILVENLTQQQKHWGFYVYSCLQCFLLGGISERIFEFLYWFSRSF